MRNAITVLAMLAVAGCATPPHLNEGADRVQVSKSDPPPGSVYVTELSGNDGSGCGGFGYKGSFANAVIVLRNEAVKVGADFVQIMGRDTPSLEYGCYDNNYQIDATAYRTPNAPPTYEQKVYRLGAQPVAQTPATPQADPVLSKTQWQQDQLETLKNEKGLSYEDYMKRYNTIMGE